MDEQSYKIDAWGDAEHCVYHALTDDPKELTPHRIAHVVGKIAATLIEKDLLTIDELEAFLHSSRG